MKPPPLPAADAAPTLATLATLAAMGCLATALPAAGQTQSLAFGGGVLFNPRVELRNLGHLPPSAAAGPATGANANRTYTDGFNRVDNGGNLGGTTAFWGYQDATQEDGDALVLTAPGGARSVSVDDAADLLCPSANLEYRGSLGPVGESDWGMLLSVGYQNVTGGASGTFGTDAFTLVDRFGLAGTPASSLPAAPYAGTAAAAGGPRIGSVPTRSFRPIAGGRTLSGNWDFEADLIPISGGLYIESQLLGRLNGVASAGVFVAFVNADLRYNETSTIAGAAPVTSSGGEGGNDVIYGGFVQLGLDWALWETASLIATARWQPSQEYTHSVNGREATMDFTTAVALHFGFSMRF